MRILICNKYWYHRGGDCIYSIEIESLLQKNGHETAHFSMQYEKNIESKWDSFSPSEISLSPRRPLRFIKAIIRPFFSLEVGYRFKKLIKQFKPDVIHLNNIHTQLSPIIAMIAKRQGVPVVWTLHDYKLLCPRYDCLRNGKPCEICFENKAGVLRNRCMKGSYFASLLAYIEAKKWNRSSIESCTEIFICPSEFIKQKMIQGGFVPNKLTVLPNFYKPQNQSTAEAIKENFYVYVGRLSIEKGISTLLKVASKLPFELRVLGTGPLELELKERYQNSENIQFMGHQSREVVIDTMRRAKVLVLPSEWYENYPLTLIEALANGTRVIASNIGGIPEIIRDEKCGVLFTPGDTDELSRLIQNEMDSSPVMEKVSFISPDEYYKSLREIYLSLGSRG